MHPLETKLSSAVVAEKQVDPFGVAQREPRLQGTLLMLTHKRRTGLSQGGHVMKSLCRGRANNAENHC